MTVWKSNSRLGNFTRISRLKQGFHHHRILCCLEMKIMISIQHRRTCLQTRIFKSTLKITKLLWISQFWKWMTTQRNAKLWQTKTTPPKTLTVHNYKNLSSRRACTGRKTKILSKKQLKMTNSKELLQIWTKSLNARS